MNHDVTKAPSKEEVLRDFFAVWRPETEGERVSISDCLGRVAAENLYSVNRIPAVRISAMDGFAVKSENFAQGTPDVGHWVLGVDFVPADTGDDFPDEYDTVIPVEQLHYNDEGVLNLIPEFAFKKGSSVRPAGCMMEPGDLLVEKGSVITPELRANLAIGGIERLLVVRKPRVAFLPTGSELIPAGEKPGRGQNIDSNSLMISDYLQSWGAEPVCYPITRDDPQLLEQRLNDAMATCDMVLINGGSSKGTEDFNARLLEQRAEYFHHTVRTVPGRPVGIALIDGKPVINMPGPVMAAWVVSDWLVKPMVCRWLGMQMPKRKHVEAILTKDMKKGPVVELYTKVMVEEKKGVWYATPMGKGARTSETLREGRGLLVCPLGSTGYEAGETVTIELIF